MLQDEAVIAEIETTLYRSSIGFGIALVLGTSLGLLAGFFATASMMSRPIVTILVGMPPIAWIVLAMIWFGMGMRRLYLPLLSPLFLSFLWVRFKEHARLMVTLKRWRKSFHFPWHMRFLMFTFHISSLMFSCMGQCAWDGVEDSHHGRTLSDKQRYRRIACNGEKPA